MDTKEKELRDRIAAASPDGFIDQDEEREMAGWAASVGLGNKFDTIMTEECLKNNIVRANTAKGQLSKYIETNYGSNKLSKKDVDAIINYARTLIPTGNNNPDEAWAEMKEQIVNPALEGKVKGGSHAIFISVIIIAMIAIGIGIYFITNKQVVEKIVKKEKIVRVGPKTKELSQAEKQNIDRLIDSMRIHVDQGLYTDPPENCAKGDLDAIRAIDPNMTYRKAAIEDLISVIVDKYITLARKDYKRGNLEKTKKWIARAKLFFRESEIIRDFEREIGLIQEH